MEGRTPFTYFLVLERGLLVIPIDYMIFLSSFLDATKDVYVNKFLAQQDFFFNCDSLHARLNSHYKEIYLERTYS